ncbi:MAG: hypothetical protein JSU98_03925 [Gemmatimonadales bacterium]|nr:MAG: hypothetical protein JSU98_03925 [Gemmatimonadales bacterium]
MFRWLRSLPTPFVIFTALVAVSLFLAGSVTAYRTFDYIEHDNDFCMSCHLMAQPFERFASSAHRDLGCKACHKPSFVGRTQMALTQVVENPEEINAHAEVPNDKCASCHIDGDREKWALVARSAGHRAHLESEDPNLQGLQCVQCHSSGVHEFAATDRTCGQSGCHDDVTVRLGRMGDFTIHCVACHSFNSVVQVDADRAAAQTALAPSSNECLSCHAMRTLVEMLPDEPHAQVCSTCHNPHEQSIPAEAARSCATVGCHDDVLDLSSFHRGLDHGSVENCLSCHQAHQFRLDGTDCLSCHQDVFEDQPGDPGRITAMGAGDLPGPGGPGPAPPASGSPTQGSRPTFTGFGLGLPPSSFLHLSAAQVQQERTPRVRTGGIVFSHGNHRQVECLSCHVSSEAHGQLTLQSIDDCRSCHHETQGIAEDCAGCHAADQLGPQRLVARDWVMDLSVSPGTVRNIPFRHGDHLDAATCGTCHQEGLARPADTASCNDCHEQHHESPSAVDCTNCHAPPPRNAHSLESHVTCTGSGCHESPPVGPEVRVRSACLTCHGDQVDHQPGGECAECHALPRPLAGED